MQTTFNYLIGYTVILSRLLVHKGRSMCYHVYVITHVKDPELSVVRLGHRVKLAGFCLSLNCLHVLNMDVNIIQTKIKVKESSRHIIMSKNYVYIMLVTKKMNVDKSYTPGGC